MGSLAIALAILSAVAAVSGYFFGLCLAFANDECAEPNKHPLLHALTRRSNPLKNMILSFAGWALFLYLIPTLVFYIAGVEDISAYAMSFCAQIAVGYIGMFVGERRWKYVA